MMSKVIYVWGLEYVSQIFEIAILSISLMQIVDISPLFLLFGHMYVLK